MSTEQVKIYQFEDNKGNKVAPKVPERAVVDSKGITLDNKLKGLGLDAIKEAQDAAIAAVEASSENLSKNVGLDEYETFSDAKAYSAGDTVMYNGLLYTFTTDHAAGAFDEGQVEETSLKKEIDKINSNGKINIFVDSYQNLNNPQNCEVAENNKIIKVDGTLYEINSYNTYVVKNTEQINKFLFVYYDFGEVELTNGVFLNVALYDINDRFLFGYIVNGEKIFAIPYNYTLKISVNIADGVPIYGNVLSKPDINNINYIDCVGDSLTAADFYEQKLKELSGIETVNLGVGGEGVGTILGRMNGIPYKVSEDFTIPANTDKVQIKLTNIYKQLILPLLQGSKELDVSIGGIDGVLTTTQTDIGAETADYYFNRANSGEDTIIKAGENIYITSNRLYQDYHRAKIIWVGQNGGFSVDETSRYQGSFQDEDDVNRYINMIKTYINVVNPIKYIILSPPKNTGDYVENRLEEEFGDSYINVRKKIINNGIRIALQNGYLNGEYPTADDLEDISNNIIPRSLRADAVHFNQAGYYTLAHIIYDTVKIIWNLGN